MSLSHLGIFALAAAVYRWVLPARWRQWALLVGSVLAVYWLQPTLPIRYLDFALPTATLALVIAYWGISQRNHPHSPDDWRTLGVVLGLVLAVAATRYLAPELRLTSRPPDLLAVVAAVAFVGGLTALIWWRVRRGEWLYPALLWVLIGLFALVKTEVSAVWLSGILRGWVGQDVSLASPLDLQWLGFSYVIFRVLHMVIDGQRGLLPALTLCETLSYVIFFPAFTAGPIDRAERFAEDFRALPTLQGREAAPVVVGLGRIALGLLKKFIIADTLALIALTPSSVEQAQSPAALWVLLYVYAFRLFFDFSGYSDIAIGIALLFGVKLPENFDRPYLKNTITAFWQSWHMTLSQWVRFYVFSPLSRRLLRRQPKLPNWFVLFVCHLSTMLIIGLWHGVTWPFFIWGLWHGVGLFVHKQWSDHSRKWYRGLSEKPALKRLWHGIGVVLTFHFVVLGWVWFALPDLHSALTAFLYLFGVQ